MTEQTRILNIPYNIKLVTIKALNKNKLMDGAAKELGVSSKRVVERLIREHGITYDNSQKKYIAKA